MGRVLLKTSRERLSVLYRFLVNSSTHQISTLRKTNEGRITKQLTAAEKRKRMIEAGTKYAAQNRKIKANCSAGAHFMKLSVKTVPGSTVKIGSCRKSTVPLKLQQISPKKDKQLVDTSISQQSAHETILNRSETKSRPRPHFMKAPLKPINEVFERDDAALTSILNRYPQNSLSGRSSMFRGRERPSLFPNGVNPLDTAAVKFAKPLPLTTLTARSLSLEVVTSTKFDATPILVTPSSTVKMSKRTPVGFLCLKQKRLGLTKASIFENEMILDLKMKFDDILEKLRNLPAGAFTNLKEAVHQIADEQARNANSTGYEYPFNPPLNSTALSFSQSETKDWPSRSSMDCIASRTRRKVRVSQICVNQTEEFESNESSGLQQSTVS
uniref:TPX2_importin domain-containing protein n=1 Tax=Elaeophora elaphi TaxID=1147741 RepID=A0A0R3RTL9_9BILA